VLKAVGEHAQCQHLCLREGLLSVRPVGEHAGERHYLGDPTTVRLALHFHHGDAEERPREASADVLDRDTVFTRVGGDPELLLEMVSVFRDESAKLLHEIRRGVSRRDGAAVERAAHSLKGALAALAARAASAAALRLESIGRERDLSGVDAARSALEHEMGRLQKELCLLVEEPIVTSEAAS